MQDFTFYNPTKYIFGKEAINELAEEVGKLGKKVFLTYGGGSIKRNGVYDKVILALSGCEVHEFGGIEPNPRLETLVKAIAEVKQVKPDVILAVGGGSVIDGSKLIAAGADYEGDPWDIVSAHGETMPEKVIPLGVVLTISATGSEVNGNSVITKWSTHEKDFFSHDKVRPVFSIVNPEFQFSLPKEQTAYGIIDAFSHVLEQYMTTTVNTPVQDRFAEGIMLTLVEWGKTCINEPENYDARSNIVFAASMALNDLIGVGVTQDWATHGIEHVVSGFYDIPHGAGLAIITPRWMQEVAAKQKFHKMVQYGKRMWCLEGTETEIVTQAIQKTHNFFVDLGVKMDFSAWNIPAEDINKMVEMSVRFFPFGEPPITREQVQSILENCF